MPINDPKHLGGFNPEPGCSACRPDQVQSGSDEEDPDIQQLLELHPKLQRYMELTDILESEEQANDPELQAIKQEDEGIEIAARTYRQLRKNPPTTP